MSDLADFLLLRVTEDEDVAKACVGVNELAAHLNGEPIPRWARDGGQIHSDDERRILRVRHTWAREAEHITRWDPAHVLAECEAKRRIVQWVKQWPWRAEPPSSVDGLLPLLALPYADHPDYREEWKP